MWRCLLVFWAMGNAWSCVFETSIDTVGDQSRQIDLVYTRAVVSNGKTQISVRAKDIDREYGKLVGVSLVNTANRTGLRFGTFLDKRLDGIGVQDGEMIANRLLGYDYCVRLDYDGEYGRPIKSVCGSISAIMVPLYIE